MERLALGKGGEVDLVGQMVHEAAMRTAAETGRSPFEVVLEAVRERVTALLTPAQLEKPGPAERQVLRQAVEEEIARYNQAAPVHGHATLDEPADVMAERVLDEILGLGPLEPLIADPTVTEIMVNGAKNIYVEREGKIIRTNAIFESDEHLMRIIEKIVAPLGRRIDESAPYVDARLPDGSRGNAVIPPISLIGPVLTIRKFFKIPLTVDKLIELGTITEQAVELLKACVVAKLSVVVSGGTGTGKTTFLNILSGHIPNDERIITIENAAELQLRQEHVVTLESRPPNIEGRGQIMIRDLVINSLRMRPDRIIVGECRGPEAFDMLQAMNTGHEGSMSTVHANSPREAMARVENMILMAGMELPHRAIREQISSALDVVIQLERMRDGSRKCVAITEVQGMEGEVITMSDIFKFELAGYENTRAIGALRPTGLRPRFMDKIEAAGIHLPPSVFGMGQRMRF